MILQILGDIIHDLIKFHPFLTAFIGWIIVMHVLFLGTLFIDFAKKYWRDIIIWSVIYGIGVTIFILNTSL